MNSLQFTLQLKNFVEVRITNLQFYFVCMYCQLVIWLNLNFAFFVENYYLD